MGRGAWVPLHNNQLYENELLIIITCRLLLLFRRFLRHSNKKALKTSDHSQIRVNDAAQIHLRARIRGIHTSLTSDGDIRRASQDRDHDRRLRV